MPAGVEAEYRCQPGSILPTARSSTCPPGGAAAGSAAIVQATCSELWAKRAAQSREEECENRPPAGYCFHGNSYSVLAVTRSWLASFSSSSIRWFTCPSENSLATRMAFLMALALERPWHDDAHALHAQQRRAAVLRVIHALLEIRERALRENVADLAGDGGPQRFAQQVSEHLHQPFAHLQRHVADEAVAHDHVHRAAIDIAAFDVADEVEIQALQQRRRRPRHFVALVVFLADREHSHARPQPAEDDARVDLAHHRELRQHARRAIHVGPHVDHHHRASL